MRLTRSQSRQRNRDALIDAALAEMADRGYQQARLDDIAERAELTTGAVYSIFGSKRNLLLAVVARYADELDGLLAELADPRLSLAEVLTGCADAFHHVATASDARHRFAFELELAGLMLRDPTVMSLTTAGRLAKLLVGRDGHITTEQAEQLAPALAALLGGLVHRAVLEPGTVDQQYFRRSALALSGLLRT
ncbi:TetR/AcrR family transcriptional regulator [Kutzneria sp. CA-103260]|uniref:TetR/AcrR family transcriptional regulator n=1 Tax=Kutzneria sp. CA-103260 TaxID=2802641 RepID=UPI001BA57837|nr:TetR/AcrR family transcriptional regulator [Kutzneria sp. CA-103260]QUQ62512.1 HTH-type transcriptional regulator BetI [Kutzneria sp. CA-103260]